MMTETPTLTTYRIKGRWLLFARAIWIILVVITLVIFIAGVSGLYTGWHQPCNTVKPEYQVDCFKEDKTLQQFGLTRNFYAIYFPIGVTVEMLPWILVGVLIFWKKSDELFGLLFSLMLVIAGTFTLDEGIRDTAAFVFPSLLLVINGMGFIGASLLILWYRFPNGHFVPRWLRWAAILWVMLQAGNLFFPGTPLDIYNWPYPWPDGITVLFAASIIYSLVYRYRHTSDLVQIQQIKWVVMSISIVAMMYIFPILLSDLGVTPWNDSGSVVWFLTYSPLWYLSVMFVAVSLGFSILRYRLWDIDFIINRSLVYGTLTFLLAAIFGGSLFLISQFVQGQSFVIAFGVTAMIAGTSFNPTRRRIQRFVDQRFYNIQIDYQKTPPDLATDSNTQILRQTNFGMYKDLELIGRGGMAEVYKSMHPTLGMPVAIKILPPKLAVENEFRQRFEREAQVVSKLDHPNIVRIFDSGEQDGTYYIVMEYLIGKDLDQLIKVNGKLPIPQALPLIQQLASALDYAHSQGFIHRDIKPSNVLLDISSNNGVRAVLTDFGIAKILDAHTVMTRTGFMLGTFDYIAPEQIEESANVDGRADIYALGVMVYQMLTGELPFKQIHPGALLIAHLNQPPPDVCEILPDLPHHIANAIQRAMAKKPEERFSTAMEFAMNIN